MGNLWEYFSGPWRVLFARFGLICQLLQYEIRASYARSVLGLYWIVLLPILYTLVFIGVRFVALNQGAAQWVPNQIAPETTLWSALALTTGLLVFWLGSDILNRSPVGVRKHTALVTDMKFPVEVLPWLTVGLSLFNFTVRFVLLVLTYWILIGVPHWEILLVPFAVLPMLVVMVGIAYLFSAVGVFLADLEFAIQILMTALLLLSGVLFPLTIVPEPYRTILYINPIAYAIREVRKLGLDGQNAEWLWLGATLVVGLLLAGFAFWVFRRLQPRFSDAL